jgi:hypothetical protein
MIPTNTATKCFGFFQDFAGAGVSGLTVTIDILAHDDTLLVSDGVCTETLIAGLYVYPRTFTDEGLFPFVMKTTSTAVSSQELPGLWRVDNIIWNLTHSPEGEPVSIVIPPPSGAYQCRVFIPCYDISSTTPLNTYTVKFKILQPYYYDGKYHDIAEYDGILSDPDENGNQYIYQDVVWGCRLQVTAENVGIVKRGTVPALASVHVADL